MQPLLSAGDEILADPRAYRNQAPVIGELVVARHPGETALLIVKRIKAVEAGAYLLAGDNPDPEQNSSYLVPSGLILGRVTSRFAHTG